MSLPDPTNLILAAPQADGFDEASGGRDLEADVVIVGTGPGGAGIGRVLAKGGLKVVFLEEGPPQSRFRPNQANTARYHMQEAGTMVAQGSSFMGIAAGRGVGGSTLINSALSFRPPSTILDGWARLLDDPSWGWTSMEPILDEVAARIGVAPTHEGIAGANTHRRYKTVPG